jgi:hypothetical protein
MHLITLTFLRKEGKPIKLSTEISSIRNSIPDDLTSLALLFNEHGWVLKITTETCVDEGIRAKASVSRDTWLGLPTSNYSIAYLTADMSEQNIIHTTRKLAELCLQMAEFFVDSFPNEQISSNGFIYDDPEMKEVAKEGALPLLEHIASRRHINDENKKNGIYFRFGFAHLLWDGQDIIFNESMFNALEEKVLEKYHS